MNLKIGDKVVAQYIDKREGEIVAFANRAENPPSRRIAKVIYPFTFSLLLPNSRWIETSDLYKVE